MSNVNIKDFIDAVERMAFEIPPPNQHTPRLVQLCQAARSALVHAPEARAIEPWMLDRVIDHLTMSGWFLGDYQNMSVKEVLTKWKDSLPPQNTHEEG